MKNLLLSAFLTILSLSMISQDCYWLKGATGGSPGNAYGKNIATDKHGNVYAIGDYDGTSIKLGTTTLTNTNGSNYGGMYLAKYGPDGSFKWAKGTQNGEYMGVTADKAGHIYVTGNYVSSIAFGTHTLTCPGGGIFLTKYDTSGNVIWAKGTGGILVGTYDEVKGISVDEAGDPLITGDYYNTKIIFGSDTLSKMTTNPDPDGFMAKYDSSGNALWARSVTSPQYDNGFSVTTDKANNVYFAGVFDGDSVIVNNTVIHKPAGGEVYIAKYSPSGNLIRFQRVHTGVYVMSGAKCQVAADTMANIYLAAQYGGTPLVIGTDTLPNPGGSTRLFIAKFDSSSNPLWARSATTVNYNNGNNALTIDHNGDPIITGYFLASNITFGSYVLTNPTTNQPAIYIAKYDQNGVAQWAKSSNGAGSTVSGSGVAGGVGGNVYVTGVFHGSTLGFGAASLSSSYNSSIFIVDAFNFNSGISTYTNVSCNGGHDGIAVATASGGNQPYNYLWGDTITNPTNDTAFNLPAGYHQVTISEAFGCAQTSYVILTEPPADSLHICLVTVDSISQHNIVMWDKTSFTDVDTFIVYREISTNNYQPIGAVPYDSLSLFVDTARALYFPNTGNPNAGTYRYKLRAHTSCGLYTGLSPFHNTIYFLNNNGTFYWVQPYTIQGSTNPVTSYVLERDDNTTGAWHAVASVAGTQQLVSDPLYNIYQTTASWRVKTQWAITCTPTLRQANGIASNGFGTSYSNVYSNAGFGIKNNAFNAQVKVYPTPGNGMIIIETPANKTRIEVRSMLGDVLLSSTLQKERSEINLSHLAKGSYFVHLLSDKGNAVRKVVIE